MASPNLAAFFEHQCGVFDEYTAVLTVRNGRIVRLSYGRLLELSRLSARALRRQGVRVGDRVILCAEPGPERVIAHFAILLAGAVDVSLPADLAPARCLQAIDRFGARALFADRRVLTVAVREQYGSFPVTLLHRTAEHSIPTLRELIERERTALGRLAAGAGNKRSTADPAAIMLSIPDEPLARAVVLTHGNFLSNMEALVGVLTSTEKDRILSSVPPHHPTGLLLVYFSIRNGSEISFSTPQALAGNCVVRKPTIVAAHSRTVDHTISRYARGQVGESLVRVMMRRLFIGVVGLEARARAAFTMRRASFREADFLDRIVHGLWLLATIVFRVFRRGGEMVNGFRPGNMFGPAIRVLFTGGEPLAPGAEYFLRGVGFRVAAGYWLSEAAGLVACRSMEFTGRRDRLVAETVGPMLPDTELRLVNSRGEDVTAQSGSSGEIYIRGPQVMQGYFADHAATTSAIDTGGWLRTGDTGRLTLSGELVLAPRRDHRRRMLEYTH